MATQRSQQRMGEFLAGQDLDGPTKLSRRIGVAVLTAVVVRAGCVLRLFRVCKIVQLMRSCYARFV